MRRAADPDVLDAGQVADLLGIDRKLVYDCAARGELPCRRLGRRFLFSRAAIVAWLAGDAARSRAAVEVDHGGER